MDHWYHILWVAVIKQQFFLLVSSFNAVLQDNEEEKCQFHEVYDQKRRLSNKKGYANILVALGHKTFLYLMEILRL